MGQKAECPEYVIENSAPGADPGIGLGDLIKYASVLAPFIKALTSAGPVSFTVRVLGFHKKVTVEDAA